MSICVLTHDHIKQWESSGVRPPCKYHHHTSYKKAMSQVDDDNAIFVPELRAIVMYTCVIKYIWQGRRSAGFAAMQLCPVIGRSTLHPVYSS